jgi:hypothetical protein
MPSAMHLPAGHQILHKHSCANAFCFSQRAPKSLHCRKNFLRKAQTLSPDGPHRLLQEWRFDPASHGRRVRCSAASGTALATSAESVATWMAQQGVALDKAAARPSLIDGELVLVTTRAVPRGTALLTVPDSAWITPETVAKSRIGKALVGLEPWLQLALFLIAERANPLSEYKPYVDALPTNPDLLTFWSDAELDELEGTQLLDSVQGYRCGYRCHILRHVDCAGPV